MIDQSENLTFFGCLRSTLLDVNGRHLGFTFLIDRMTDVRAPNIFRAHWPELTDPGMHSNWMHFFFLI